MQRTLAIVKPDGVGKGLVGEVMRRFEAAELKVVGLKMVRLDKGKAEGFYHVHKGKGFFDSLVSFMTSGPIVPMALEGEDAISKVRTIMGATDPAKAAEGTIRRQYAASIERNIVHGSDAEETAMFEVAYFFSNFEICG